MIRLMLVLAPIACVLAGIAASGILDIYLKTGASESVVEAPPVVEEVSTTPKEKYQKKKGFRAPFDSKKSLRNKIAEIPRELALVIVVGVIILSTYFTWHCTWIAANAYSSPSIVLASTAKDGSTVIFDDFRGSYRWLHMNTPEDARIMSWWDYGYQISAMANRTVLVDNNTWNNTHIATVGKAMSSTEEVAYKIMLDLDVDYVLVIFGGVFGYSSDDINKFLWMVRIGGGVFPEIVESHYFTPRGEYRVDAGGAPTLLNCLMYKLSYYRFGTLITDPSKPPGYDRVRNVEIGNKNIELKHLDEVYTSEHWLVRIYKVRKPNNRHEEEDMKLNWRK